MHYKHQIWQYHNHKVPFCTPLPNCRCHTCVSYPFVFYNNPTLSVIFGKDNIFPWNEELLADNFITFQTKETATGSPYYIKLPDIMSRSSFVIACWRPLLYSRVSSAMSPSAFSVAICIAIIRAECSATALSSNAVYNRRDIALGSIACNSSSLPGSRM